MFSSQLSSVMILPLSYMDVKQGHLVSSVKASGASPSKSSKSVAGKKVKSPLAHVRAWLKYLKIFGGFPLEIEDEEVTEFHLSLAGFLHVTLLYLAVATLVAGQQLVMHQYHLNMHQISEGFRSQGFSHTEIISFFFGFGGSISSADEGIPSDVEGELLQPNFSNYPQEGVVCGF